MSCTYTKLGQSVVIYEDETDGDEGYAVVATVFVLLEYKFTWRVSDCEELVGVME